MDTLATALAIALLVSPILLIAGLVRPSLAGRGASRWRVVGYFVGAVVALGLGLAVTAPLEGSAPARPATPTAAPPAPWEAARPETQLQFLAAIEAAVARYDAAENELKKSSVAKERARELAGLLPGGDASAWVGVLEAMGTNGDGNAHVTIRIGGDAVVKTWNNAISDASDRTLIAHGSALYTALADLRLGTPVVFTARLLRETSLTEAGGMQAPEFVARFTSIEPWVNE